MTKVGLSQRVEEVDAYNERRDCLDQRWAPLIRSFGLDPVPLMNQIEDVDTYVDRLQLDGIVLTGGNDFAYLESGTNVALERDRFERSLLKIAIDRELPVLGVCRGLQLINIHCGGSIRTIDDHVAVEHDLEINTQATSVTDPPAQIIVNSYHGCGIDGEDLGKELSVVGRASDGSIEWLEHERHPITGIMWHPERESPSEELDRRIISDRLPTKPV